MPRVLLVHWNAGEAAQRLALLKKAGFAATTHSSQTDMSALRGLGDDPPDAIVIDLGRLPSHGMAVAGALRQKKATRGVPLVFIEGDAEKTARVRTQLPDAVFTTWPRVGPALKRAIAAPPKAPVVPGTMEAYSGTPLPKKLGIAPGTTLVLFDAPADFERLLGDALDGVPVVRVHGASAAGDAASRERTKTKLAAKSKSSRTASAVAELVILFARSQADLVSRLPAAQAAMAPRGTLWIAWPKKASGVATDLSEPAVRKTGLAGGLVDFKICAIDATWSGLRFSRRKA